MNIKELGKQLPPGLIVIVLEPSENEYTASLFHTLSKVQEEREEVKSLMVMGHGVIDFITKDAEQLYFRGAQYLMASGKNLVEPEGSTTVEKIDPKKLN